jgi:hypothetical protein
MIASARAYCSRGCRALDSDQKKSGCVAAGFLIQVIFEPVACRMKLAGERRQLIA